MMKGKIVVWTCLYLGRLAPGLCGRGTPPRQGRHVSEVHQLWWEARRTCQTWHTADTPRRQACAPSHRSIPNVPKIQFPTAPSAPQNFRLRGAQGTLLPPNLLSPRCTNLIPQECPPPTYREVRETITARLEIKFASDFHHSEVTNPFEVKLFRGIVLLSTCPRNHEVTCDLEGFQRENNFLNQNIFMESNIFFWNQENPEQADPW